MEDAGGLRGGRTTTVPLPIRGAGEQTWAMPTELARRLADAPRGAIRGTKRIFARLAMTLGAGFFEFAAEIERLSLYSEGHRDVLRAMAAEAASSHRQ